VAFACPPTVFPVQHPLQRAPAVVTAKSLQRRPPARLETHVTARTITRLAEKKSSLSGVVMTHARLLRPSAQAPAPVPDDGRFVAASSCGLARFPGTVAGSSTSTSAAPPVGIPHCSTVPSDASAETAFRIPSPNRRGSAAAVIFLFSVDLGLDFPDDLRNLGWGSWEVLLPEGSSLGGDASPLRGASLLRALS
jgi:hypothetical protein